MNKDQMKEQFQILTINLKKYRYPVLILAIGIILMLLPKNPEPQIAAQNSDNTIMDDNLEERLEQLLSQIEGAGKVKVMLSIKVGPEETYWENTRSNTYEQNMDLERELVMIRDGSGTEAPVPLKTIYPVYRGAVVVCQGANRATVKLDIIRAVSSLTGLGSDKITVIKMKGN